MVIFALSAAIYFPFSQWIATTPVGTSFFLQMQLAWLLASLLSIALIPVLVFCLCIQRTRQRALHYLLPAILLIPSCVIGIWIGDQVRMSRMHAFAQRSSGLVAAIDQYTRNHGIPPASLESLLPDYLPSIPSTGMMAYPRYEYHVGPDASEELNGNPWALTVFTPSGGINFDSMLYLPQGNYPETGYGGYLERIGDWAYVHE